MLYGLKLIPEIHDALYFAANTYTSLGYGDMLLTYDWRKLSPDGHLRRIHLRLHHHSTLRCHG